MFRFVVCIVRVLGLWSASFACWVLWSVVLCRVVISLVVLPLVSVVLSLLLCVSVFCASCAFWGTHQHGITREVSLPTLLCGVCFVSLVW